MYLFGKTLVCSLLRGFVAVYLVNGVESARKAVKPLPGCLCPQAGFVGGMQGLSGIAFGQAMCRKSTGKLQKSSKISKLVEENFFLEGNDIVDSNILCLLRDVPGVVVRWPRQERAG